ncbi:conserved hypothetical protein [Vibrio chagasii]|nr:conserved hypothetical protein [Vibrio chagasii]
MTKQINVRPQFTFPLPKDEAGLDALVAYHSQFTDKYWSVKTGGKSSDRFRDYVCESLLGMTNGGYQQLLAIWKTQAAAEAHALESRRVTGQILPKSVLSDYSEFYLTENDNEEWVWIKPEDRLNHFNSRDDLCLDDVNELPELELTDCVTMSDEFLVRTVWVSFPNARKYGVPELACYSGLKELLKNTYGLSAHKDLSIMAYDTQDDSGTQYLFELVKR